MRSKSLIPAALLALSLAALLCIPAFGAASNSFITGEALATQAVCDAVLDSAEAKKWEDVVQV